MFNPAKTFSKRCPNVHHQNMEFRSRNSREMHSRSNRSCSAMFRSPSMVSEFNPRFFGSKPFFQRPYRNNDFHVAIFGTNQLCEQTNFLPHRASSHIARLVAKFDHFDEYPLVIFRKKSRFKF